MSKTGFGSGLIQPCLRFPHPKERLVQIAAGRMSAFKKARLARDFDTGFFNFLGNCPDRGVVRLAFFRTHPFNDRFEFGFGCSQIRLSPLQLCLQRRIIDDRNQMTPLHAIAFVHEDIEKFPVDQGPHLAHPLRRIDACARHNLGRDLLCFDLGDVARIIIGEDQGDSGDQDKA